MKITYTRDAYYDSAHDIMNLVKFIGDFEITGQDEDKLVLDFPDNYAGIAEYYQTFPMDGLAEDLTNAYLQKKVNVTKNSTPKSPRSLGYPERYTAKDLSKEVISRVSRNK